MTETISRTDEGQPTQKYIFNQGRTQDLSEGGARFFFDLKDLKRVKIND